MRPRRGTRRQPRRRRPVGRAGVAAGLAVLATALLACTSDAPPEPAPPGDGQGVATTSLTTTTFQPLDDLVNASDRPPVTAGPPGRGAAADATGQIRAIAATVADRDGPFTGAADAFVDAIGAELLALSPACDVAPTIATTTTGVGPAVGTIDLTFGCDPTTDSVQYVLTLAQPGSVENPTEAWVVTAATRAPNCVRGVLDGACV